MHHWHLVKEMAAQDFKIKYQKTRLGLLWAVIGPLVIVSTLSVAFTIVMRIDVPYPQLFVVLGMVLWSFFSETTNLSMTAIESRLDMMGKINFPKWTVIMSSTINSLITFVITMAVFFVMMLVIRVEFLFWMILAPLYLAELVLFITGVCFLLPALCIKRRDVAHIWTLVTTIGFWLTPIIYQQSDVPQPFQRFYYFNPMARLINEIRDSLLYGKLHPLSENLVTFCMCFGVFAVGVWFFRLRSPLFAEVV